MDGRIAAMPVGRAEVDPRDLVCGRCGYGIVSRGRTPTCPMCRAHDWRPPRRPLGTRFAVAA